MAIAQQLSIDTTNTALDLANEMFGSGIQVLSATFNGSADATSIQAGIYSGALTTIPGISPTDTGVILSTGNVQNFAPYTDGSTDTNRAPGTSTDTTGIDGDSQLNTLAGANTFDAAIFQASFIPDANFITLQFVFSSEEYLEYVSGGFNDAFGVWVNGVYAPVTPLAGGSAAIDTINLTQNPNLFLNNPANTDPYNSEMDGLTRVLTVKAPVNAGQANTIKIAIADAGDAGWDSNVLIMGNSIQTMAIAVQDNVNMLASSTRTVDVLSNDTDSTDGGLTITHINGTAVIPGGSVTLPSGEVVTLNADKTLTIQTNAGTGASVFTYSVLDSAGNTDVGFVNLTVVSTLTPDGIVHGTTGGDLIQTGYLGDPDGDRVDNNDALGVGGTTGDGDYVLAMGGNDTVRSGAGNDIVYAGSGNDSVDAGAGNDYVSLGEGDDTFGAWSADNAGNDTIDGDAGNDQIIGGAGDDIVYGGDGNDTLSGQHGADTLFGGAGDDLFLITDDHEGDTISGGDGVDQIAFGNFLTAAGITVTATGNDSGTYAFNATPGGFVQAQGSYDTVEALALTGNADTYNGAAATGDITVEGGGGNDTLTGGASNDALYGGGDNDILTSGGGADTLSGGAGADRLVFNTAFANSTAIGGGDYDILDLSTYPNAVSVTFTGEGAGTITDLVTGAVVTFSEIEEMILTPQSDVVDATADNGYTYIQTRDGNDLITGSAGDDIYDDEIGAPNGQGNDTFFGAGGNDVLWMGNDDDLAYGGTGNDQLGGEAGNDTLHGDDGDDTVAGYTGNDVLYGGAGTDTVNGDEGADTLYGGIGADSLSGGADADTIVLQNGFGNDTITGGEGTTTGTDSDTIDAGAVTAPLTVTFTGNEQGTLTNGTDTATFLEIENVFGGTASDSLDARADSSGVGLFGNAGNDTIQGGTGADYIVGGDDADMIYAGAGDTVFGGEGGTDNDTLVLNWADVESITYGGGNNEAGVVTFTAASGGGTLTFSEIENINYIGPVDGTAGDDVMNIGHVDAQGDIIDGADGDVDTIFGYGGNDSIDAGADTDLVYGGTGNDTVTGGAGNDTILGEDGADSLFGDDGNDTISGGDSADMVDGDAGSDSLSGDAGNDTLVGDDGNDTLSGGTGDDQVYASGGDNIASGDAGADQLFMGTGADTLYGGAGNDTMGGGAGDDLLYGDRITFVPGEHASPIGGAATSFTFQNNSTQTVTLYWVDTAGVLVSYGDFAPGTSGLQGTFTGHNWVIYDTATGAPLEYLGNPANGATVTYVDGNDFLSGDAGNDTLYGEAGADALYGGDDADRLFGGAGNDTLGGDAGDDSLEGGDGDDSLMGGLGADTLLGGAGNDTLDGGDGDDQIFAGDGADLIEAGDGNDYVLGEGGADTIYGGAGNDTLLSRADSDLVYGGDGNDSMLGLTGNDTFFGGTGADTMFGGADDDLLAGDDGNDSIFGDDGNDQVQGGAGLDSLYGGIGNDTLDGGDDADELFGDAGSDSILGGAGADTAYGGTGADTLAGGGDNDLLFGGDDGDLLQGDGGDDVLWGDLGADTLDGGDGNDTLIGGDAAGLDTSADLIYGGAGNDLVEAGAGADTVDGGDGNDTIRGEAGSDSLSGGADRDLFVMATGGGTDTIAGGEAGDDFDTIDTTAVLSAVEVRFTGDEAGEFGDTGGTVGAVFTEIEALQLGAGNDTVDASATTSGITVDAGAGDDLITGGSGADTLTGGLGGDTITGGAGNDLIDVGAGDGAEDLVVLADGSGNDTITGFAAPVDNGDGTFTGLDQLDVSGLTDAGGAIVNTDDVTVSDDGAGNAVLTFPNGESITLVGVDPAAADNPAWLVAIGIPAPDYVVEGTAGADLIDATYTDDPEGDRVDAGDNQSGTDDDVILAGDGNDTVVAGQGNDTIDGGIGDDLIYGGDGADSVIGAGGADTIYGGIGNDTISSDVGGIGNDLVFGEEGDDSIRGGSAQDTLYGGVGNDTLFGDDGDDLLSGEDGDDALYTGPGNDTVYGGTGNDTLFGFAGTNELYGGDDRDLFAVRSVAENIVIQGGEGGDDLDGITTTDRTDDLNVAFSGNEAGTITGTGLTVSFTEIEEITLGSGNDTLDASATTTGVSVASSGDGDDLLIGGSGNDTMASGAGADTIEGGAGDDLYELGAGDADPDVIVLADGFGNDTVQGLDAPIDNGDGTFTGLDLLDVSGLTDANGAPVNTDDVTVSDDGLGNAVLTFPNGESITLLGVPVSAVSSPAQLAAMGIPAPDYIVEGTAGNDLIDGSYLGDPEGDMVDAGDNAAGTDDDVIDAGAGNDTVLAGAGNDTVYGGNGDDLAYGGDGDDLLEGVNGNDTLYGDDGNDTLFGTVGNNELYGGEGVDSIRGGAQSDTIDGGAGDDNIQGWGGENLIYGGDGADTITGGGHVSNGNDTIYAGAGNDAVYGGQGDDLVFLEDGDDQFGVYGDDVGNDTVSGGLGNDTINGAGGDDLLSGDEGDDVLAGGDDNDTLYGGAGNDTIFVQPGEDEMYGGDDRDTFQILPAFGAWGQNTIEGGEGGDDRDVIDASDVTVGTSVVFSGNEAGILTSGTNGITFVEIEEIALGAGNDTVDASATSTGILVDAGAGADSILGGAGADTITAGSGADTVQAGAGNDQIALGSDGAADVVVFGDGDGNDTITGFEAPLDNGDGTFTGADLLDVSGLTDAGGAPVNTDDVTVSEDSAGNAVLTFPNGESITLLGVPVAAVSSPAQLAAMGIPVPDYVVEGTTGGDLIDGSYLGDPEGDMVDAGDNAAGTDDDVIDAGAGNDTVYAGSGNDTADGGTGDDLIDGGLGDDQLFGGSGTGSDTLYGGDGNDTITDYLGDDVIFGGVGDDLAYGGGDADEIHGDDGNDDLRGSSGSDTLYGGTGNDSLYGGSDNDELSGGDGDDLLHTGPGNDTAFGGQGSDTFILDDGHGTNVFEGGEDAGDTDLDVIDASAHSGDASVVFTGNEAGTISAGTDSATFSEIEGVQTGAGNDTIDASATTGGVTVLTSGDGDDLLIGGSGDDVFGTGSGADTVDAGAGNDTYELGAGDGAADIVVFGDGDGADTVQGFEAPVDNGDGTFTGQDLLDVSGLTDAGGAPVNTDDVTVSEDSAGNAVLTFPNGESITLEGVPVSAVSSPEQLAAMGIPLPDYVVEGTAGNDTIDGSYTGDPEGDMVDAGDNAAGTDDDVIDAGAGDDLVLAGAGNDTVYGGDGADTLEGGVGNDSLQGDEGADSILGGDGNDTVRAGNGDDTVVGGAGDDSLFGFTGNDSVSGGDGNDYINTRTETGVGVPDRGYPGFYTGDADTANDLDTVDGGMGNDTILTGDDNDYVLGGAGSDSIDGGFDDDTLQGQAGNDTILGNEGRDFIEGGAGSDLIYGGLTLGEADALNLTDAVDLVPDNNMDTLFGGDGNDTIYGMDDADELYGGSGNDLLDGGIDNDSVFGDSGADTLVGGQGDDVLDGGSGDDSVSGGAGNDTLTGGDAADTASSLPPEWSVLSGTSGSLTGTNGNGGFTQTTTSSTGGVFENAMTVALPGGGAETLSGYQVGNGTPAQETHVHDFSQQVAGAQLRLAGINQAESVAIWLDGGRLDLNQAIADGIVSFDPGTGTPWQINEAGEISAAYDEFGVVQPAVLIINVPFQTLEVQNISPSGLGNGSLYELSVNTNPALVTEAGGNDTLDGGEGNDLIDGGDGNDSLLGGTGDDTVSGGTGDDTIGGGAGQDTILVADDGGADSIQGGEGGPVDYDTLDLSGVTTATTVTYTGAEAGSLTHGTGSADFAEIERLQLGSGDDTVTAATNAGPVSVGGGAGVDTLVLDGQAINVADVTFDDTVSGTFTPANGGSPIAFGPSEALQLSDVLATYKNGTLSVQGSDLSGVLGDVSFDSFEAAQFNVVCFVRGTRIKTAGGEVAIEDLQPGDRVLTLDNGYQPIRWIGSSQRQAVGALAPIRIAAGALGNERDLLVSPQHRMLLRGWQASLMFGEAEVLVAAKALVNDRTIRVQEGGAVEYFHMLFDRHEIVFAEGAASESFHPGQQGWKALDEATRAEILVLFPELADGGFDGYGPAARLSLKDYEGRILAEALLPRT